jgi:transposase
LAGSRFPPEVELKRGIKMGRKSAYTQEFQDAAVKAVVAEGRTVSRVAKQLGVSTNLLQNWVNKYRREVKLSSESNQVSLVQENEELRKRLAEAEEAVEILKKAAAYFAKGL